MPRVPSIFCSMKLSVGGAAGTYYLYNRTNMELCVDH
jgi:hypothetical protein